MTPPPPLETSPDCGWARFPAAAELRLAATGRDEAAWARAYAILWREGMLIAQRQMCGNVNRQNRDDVLGEAIAAWQGVIDAGRHDFRNQEGSETDGMRRMFCRIVKNKVGDYYRAHYRQHPSEEASGAAPPSAEPEGADDGGFAALFDADLHAALRAAITALEPPLPALFQCRLEGLTALETAAKLGLPRNTVLSHWSRGMTQLRATLSRFLT